MQRTEEQNREATADPRAHARRIREMLREALNHAREDEMRVSGPKALALFETTAEVLQGLIAAYEHFEQKSEPAWR